MAAGITKSCLAGARHCATALAAVAIWTVWLALTLLLALQAYVASVRQLEVPRFLVHAIESRLAESGVSFVFGRALLVPSGRVLIERARFKLASFNEPIVTARSIYISLNPFSLLEGRFEPNEVRATGADLYIPAMLSRSGSAEKVVQDLDAGFSITARENEFTVDYLNCYLGGIALSARGTINAGAANLHPGRISLPLAEFVSRNYVALSREFSRAEEQLGALDRATVTAVLTASTSRGALVDAQLFAAGVKMATPVAFEAQDLAASARFPLLGTDPVMTSAEATAGSLQVGTLGSAGSVHAVVRGVLKLDSLSFDPQQLDLACASASAKGAVLLAPVAELTLGEGRSYRAAGSAWLFNSRVSVRADVDPGAKTAGVAFEASASSGLLDPLSVRTKISLRRFVDFSDPIAVSGRVRFGPGWAFAGGEARVDGRGLVAYGVKIDEARGLLSYDGTHFAAREATVVSGDDVARGSYEQDFASHEFRYLLEGRLRPLDISPWFGSSGWWPNLFKGFAFPSRPPDATVDVRGRYQHGRDFSVFCFADAKTPQLLGIPFDRVRTRLYAAPAAFEGLDVALEQGSGIAQGQFKLATEAEHGTWSGLDLDLTSTLDPSVAAKVVPPEAAEALAAFSFDHPPSVLVRGHFDGPAADGPRHKAIHIEVRSEAGLRAHGVAFSKASFKVDVHDDAIDVSDVEAGFAGGTTTGTAAFTGSGAERRVRFRAALTGASLGQAATAAEGYVSRQPGRSTALETFAREKSDVLLDLNADAEGAPADLDSFVGTGNVQIQGADLGGLSLLGGLSRLLKITELRFTQARAQYTIEHSDLEFSEVSVIGANSAIEAKGSYSIEKRVLDFSARIYPFRESKSALQVFNTLSAPLSAAFRVKLAGSIDKPSWSFAYSPLTLLRASEVKATASEKPVAPSPLANPSP
jgi:hypothetical protein